MQPDTRSEAGSTRRLCVFGVQHLKHKTNQRAVQGDQSANPLSVAEECGTLCGVADVSWSCNPRAPEHGRLTPFAGLDWRRWDCAEKSILCRNWIEIRCLQLHWVERGIGRGRFGRDVQLTRGANKVDEKDMGAE